MCRVRNKVGGNTEALSSADVPPLAARPLEWTRVMRTVARGECHGPRRPCARGPCHQYDTPLETGSPAMTLPSVDGLNPMTLPSHDTPLVRRNHRTSNHLSHRGKSGWKASQTNFTTGVRGSLHTNQFLTRLESLGVKNINTREAIRNRTVQKTLSMSDMILKFSFIA